MLREPTISQALCWVLGNMLVSKTVMILFWGSGNGIETHRALAFLMIPLHTFMDANCFQPLQSHFCVVTLTLALAFLENYFLSLGCFLGSLLLSGRYCLLSFPKAISHPLLLWCLQIQRRHSQIYTSSGSFYPSFLVLLSCIWHLYML